jgi:hypothetical protein
MSTITKYRIGLGVIGLFTIIIAVWALVLAGPTKQDSSTYNAANNIANNINNYTGNNGIAPYSLSDTGSYNVPATITYDRLSDYSYRFCVNYKTTSSDFSASAVESDLITSSVNNSTTNDNPVNYSSDGYLYIDTSHHKGNNCQVINLSNDNIYNYQD